MENLFGHDKVEEAIERIKMFVPPEGYYLAFSGGKDSQCIYHLAEMAGVKFDAHFHLTTLDPPELIKFVRKNYSDVTMEKPSITMWNLMIQKRMPPTRIVRYCCEFLKERSGYGRRILTGVRWEESFKRSKRKIAEPCLKNKTKYYVNPIIDWKENEVWEFLKPFPHCSLYDPPDNFKRIGCIGCPMAGDNRKFEFERWPHFKSLWFKGIVRCFQERKRLHLADDSLKWQSAEDMWNWWMQSHPKGNPDQTVMFE